jgi:hypothetical protein
LGQKLKNLGHAITGHFNIWQDQTRQVFRKAQDSTESIEASFNRMGGVVSGMEAVLKELSEVVARSEVMRTRESESAGARPNGSSAGVGLRPASADTVDSSSLRKVI